MVESPEDVDGVLDLCHVLIKDQSDSSAATAAAAAGNLAASQGSLKDIRRQGPYFIEREEMAEEQGWVARMVHLFRAESLDVQFEVRHSDIGLLVAFLNALFHSFYKLLEDISTPEASACALHSLPSSLLPLNCVDDIRIENTWFAPRCCFRYPLISLLPTPTGE